MVNQIRKLSQTSKDTSCKPETTSYTELKRDNSKGLSGMKKNGTVNKQFAFPLRTGGISEIQRPTKEQESFQ